ncbi:cytokine receptor common subunit gamma-like isoform X1 [Embiotoca jacksoni]|uniref:cytokine receptor common subunit gamma-like isoform X1 n=1 Tax=Embiotoca jacksoni TaxID=100190 RepID=UPI003703BC66
MPMTLLLLLCLIEPLFARKPPDVDCLVVQLEYVHCIWDANETPEVNYTFSSRFHHDKVKTNCTTYLSKNGVITGCNQPYKETKRFSTFYVDLEYGNETFRSQHELKSKVKLYPPTNLTIKNESDSNLWLYWNQTASECVESEVRVTTNTKTSRVHEVSRGRQNYCINWPSSTSRYELQVRSKMGTTCGESESWSEWSDPVIWGSNNGTETNQMNGIMSVWMPVLCVVGAFTLLLLVLMLLHHERLRIILIPVVPKPSLIPHDIEDWFQFSKGLKEGFKSDYNERACIVREYCHVSQSDNESSDGSTFSVTTDQTDCCTSVVVNEAEDLSAPFSSSTSSVSSEENQQVSV